MRTDIKTLRKTEDKEGTANRGRLPALGSKTVRIIAVLALLLGWLVSMSGDRYQTWRTAAESAQG